MGFFTICCAKEIPISQYRIWGRKYRMLQYFEERIGKAVALPDILRDFKDISDPTRTIRYLCADGYDIENIVKHIKGKAHSTYTYNWIGDYCPKKKEKKYTQAELDSAVDIAHEVWYQSAADHYTK